MSFIACVNGQFLDIQNASISILDRGFLYGDGLFETLRARKDKVFRIRNHLKRLETSAKALKIPLPFPVSDIATLVTKTLHKNSLDESVIRLQLTRGESDPGLLPSKEAKSTLVIAVRPFNSLPNRCYQEGVSICSVPDSATATSLGNHRIKATQYLAGIQLRMIAEENNCFEAIGLDASGNITEGTVTNISIVKNGAVLTPPLSRYVLNGITRSVIQEVCLEEGISWKELNLSMKDVNSADEVFLTNTGVGVLPVTISNDQRIGNGLPGTVTRNLARLYVKKFDTEIGSC